MIVGKLLNLLSNMNVFLMLTSNADIDSLYKNGLQRDKFIKQMQQLGKNLVLYEFTGDRKFSCKGSTKDFIWLSYKDFFKQNLAISDFLAICKNFEWFFIDDFEQYDDYGKDVIRRFIGFIDIAYIEKVKIKFFINNEDMRNLYEGRELIFLWDRTLSRLEEMRDINK